MRALILTVAMAAILRGQPLTSPQQDYGHFGQFDLSNSRQTKPDRVVLLTPGEDSVCLNPFEVVYAWTGNSRHVCRPSTFAGGSGVWKAIGGAGGLADPGANGVMKRTSAGVTAAAVVGTDYVVPSGNVATSTALAANGANCAAGQAALGVDASGAAEGCFVAGGGAGASSQLTDFSLAGTGTGTLTIACATGRCNVSTGDTVTAYASLAASCTLAAGSYTAYVYADSGGLKIGASTIPTSCSSATAVGSVTAYPANTFEIGRITVVTGSITAITDDRAAYNAPKTLVAGTNITTVETATAITINASGGGGTPGGANTQVQFNNSGAFGASSAFTHNSGTGATVIVGSVTAGANGRVAITQDGAATGMLSLNDNFGNNANFGINPSLVPGADTSLWVGASNSSTWLAFPAFGGIQFNKTNAKPTCAAAVRGLVYYVAGAGGVKDNFEVCAKDSADAYAWRVMY